MYHHLCMGTSLLTFQGTVRSHHSVILAQTCNRERGNDPFLLPFMSCPKTRKSHSPRMQQIKILPLLWITSKPPQSLSQVPLSLPWSFINCKDNKWLSPKATYPGVPCMIGNLPRMLLPSEVGCLELLNYCDMPSTWAKNCIHMPGQAPKKIPWHLRQKVFGF